MWLNDENDAEAVATAVAATPMTDWNGRLGHLDGASVAAVEVAAVGLDGRVRMSGGFRNFMRTTPPRPEPGPSFEQESD